MKQLLLPVLLLVTFWAKGQEVEGIWKGYLDQTKEALQSEAYKEYWEKGIWKKGVKTHELKVTLLYDAKKEKYVGEYFINETLQKAHFARFELVATYQNKQLSYEAPIKLFEVKNQLNLGFCFSAADLVWSEDTYYEYLKGDWEGWGAQNQACAAAKMVLRRLKDPNKRPPEAEKPVEINPEVAPIDPVPLEESISTTLQEYDARAKITKEIMTVKKDSISIDVWDGNREDGDVISLVFNGKVLLEQHTLTKTKRSFRVALQRGQNILTLIAHNLGDIPPNTAALEVERNEGRKKITLSSDMNRSESVLILKE
ncbi:MAG: hypothetical protein ACRBFS_00860 [Aureispira sp.]